MLIGLIKFLNLSTISKLENKLFNYSFFINLNFSRAFFLKSQDFFSNTINFLKLQEGMILKGFFMECLFHFSCIQKSKNSNSNKLIIINVYWRIVNTKSSLLFTNLKYIVFFFILIRIFGTRIVFYFHKLLFKIMAKVSLFKSFSF